ncbi:MAG: hypothetical protein HQK54_00340 [Oligoflexales bacterium]|nr:hypothetical protein [Oligoflexales bacterium]
MNLLRAFLSHIIILSFFHFIAGCNDQDVSSSSLNIQSANETCGLPDVINSINFSETEPDFSPVSEKLGVIESSFESLVSKGDENNQEWYEHYSCLLDGFSSLFQKINRQENQLSVKTKLAASSILREMNRITLKITSWAGSKNKFSEYDVQTVITNPDEAKRFSKFFRNITLYSISEAIKNISVTQYETGILGLIPFLYAGPVEKEEITIVKEMIESQPDHESRLILAKLVCSRFLKGGFYHTEFYREHKIKFLQSEIKRFEFKPLDRLKGFPGQKKVRAYLKSLKEELANLGSGPFSISSQFASLQEEMTIPDKAELIAEAKSYAIEKFRISHPNFAFEHQNGDIYLNVTEYGFGHLYARLGNFPDFMTHSGLILKGEDEGLPYYFVAEFAEKGFNVGGMDTNTLKRRVFLRPKFQIPEDFGLPLISNLEAMGKSHFDVNIVEGIFDDKGEVSLYCAEFIHYAFKNQFIMNRNSTSPLDYVDNKPSGTDISLSNARRMGLDTSQNFYAPDSFFYSPMISFIGLAYNTVEDETDNLTQKNFFAKKAFTFNEQVIDHFFKYRFNKLSLKDRIKAKLFEIPEHYKFLQLFLRRVNYDRFGFKRYFPLPKGDSGVYFIKFAQLPLAFESLLEEVSVKKDGTPNPVWQSDFEKKYRKKVAPLFRKVFKTD